MKIIMNTKLDHFNNALGKAIYFVDLLILSIVTLFGIFQICYWLYPTRWIIYIFFFQRANVSFLLYRKEKAALWPVIVSTLLFVPFFYIYDDAFMTAPGCFLSATLEPDYNAISKVFPTISNMLFWVWLMPIVYYCILRFRKQTVDHKPSWQQLAGLAFVQSRTGWCFLALFLLVFLAFVSGATLQLYTSHYALLIIPLATYYLINKYLKRKPCWWEFVSLFAAMWIFDLSRTQTDFLRVFGLALSAIIVFFLCIFVYVKTKHLLAVLYTFVAVAFLLPTLIVGYNLYSVTDAVVLRNYEITESTVRSGPFNIMYTFRYDKDEERYSYGMRNRYRELIPCKYTSIKPAHDHVWRHVMCCTEQDTIVDNIFSFSEEKHK